MTKGTEKSQKLVSVLIEKKKQNQMKENHLNAISPSKPKPRKKN
jgi:hypothetical protein